MPEENDFTIESCVQCSFADIKSERCIHPDFKNNKNNDWENMWINFDIFEGCPLIYKVNKMKRCPKCKDNKVVIFDSDKDWCPKCNKYFPTVKEEKDACETGCRYFYGGEIRHHKDCYFYPESFTEMYDNLKLENNKFEESLKMSSNNEENEENEEPTTIEWLKGQYEELLDIRKIVYNLYPDIDEGLDVYFPDLIKKQLKKLKTLEKKEINNDK